ncbi:MAG: hypothetical protein KIS74_02935 [Burkholderiales bacterium]|nr:hypothetical protein [Burkholderiales bacterium]
MTTTTALVPTHFYFGAQMEVACLKGDARRAVLEAVRANPKVGYYANRKLWTDVDPYEIVRVVSEKCLDVRPMKATPDPTWKPEFIPGGFFGHTANNHDQRWLYERDPKAPTIRIRKHKNGTWKDASGMRFNIALEPHKHHDYNF